jgi:type II secretory pathway component PulM
MAALLQYYAKLSEREQRILLAGGVAALILIILAILMPLQRHVGDLTQRVEQKRDDLVWLRSMAPQLAGLRSSSGPQPLNESLVVLVDRTARQSGLQRAVVGSQPDGDVSVRLEQTPFDGLLTWLSQLRQSYGVRVDSAVVETGASAGTVNANLVLRAH